MDQDQLPTQQSQEPPAKPLEYQWLAQRQVTPNDSYSLWKFAFTAPDGSTVKVTFHQLGAEQDTNTGQPQTTNAQQGVYYVIFFNNRNPEFFAKWDVSLSHEDSLTVWVTITHGIIDFMQKAMPQNLVMDDLANGKLKMVLKSLAVDITQALPDYELEMTQKHHYRTLFQVKKKGTESAFDTEISGDQKDAAKQEETQDPKQLTVEIDKDYNVAVMDQDGKVIEQYKAQNPSEILKFLHKKNYMNVRMKVKETKQEAKPVDMPNTQIPESMKFEIDGAKVKVNELLAPKLAAYMNERVPASKVIVEGNSVTFEYETTKDMIYKKTMLEMAYNELN